MGKRGLRVLSALVLVFAMFAGATIPGASRGIVPGPGGDAPILRSGVESNAPEEDENEAILERDLDFIDGRTAGDTPLSVDVAGKLRGNAVNTKKATALAPSGSSFAAGWTALGPNPTQQISNGALQARSGRIGALAIRHNGQWILGGAQGGIWLFNSTTGRWESKTDQLPSLAIGALAVAPSNDNIVYAGTAITSSASRPRGSRSTRPTPTTYTPPSRAGAAACAAPRRRSIRPTGSGNRPMARRRGP